MLTSVTVLQRAAAYFSVSTEESVHFSAGNILQDDAEVFPDSVYSADLDTAVTGVYLTATSVRNRDLLLTTFDRLASLEHPAVVFDVKGSYVYIEGDFPQAEELRLMNPFFNLAEIVSLARDRGIYTIARFIVAKDTLLSARSRDTQICHPQTKICLGSGWVDPGNSTVFSYNQEVLEAVLRSGVDEVNFDYIRYPTEYAQSQIGLSGSQKADHIEQFILMARETIDRIRPQTKLGISTYAILGWNFPVNLEPLGQDIVRFAPYVDIISPMAYPATFAEGSYYNPAVHPVSRMYYLVYRTITGYRELLGPEYADKVRPWIQGYYVSAQNMRDQIAAVFDAGAHGFTVWNAQNNYTPVFTVLAEGLPDDIEATVVLEKE
jgi:hypothetical protein